MLLPMREEERLLLRLEGRSTVLRPERSVLRFTLRSVVRSVTLVERLDDLSLKRDVLSLPRLTARLSVTLRPEESCLRSPVR